MLSRLRQPSLITHLHLTTSLPITGILCSKRTIIIKSPFKYIEPINKSFAEQLLKKIWRHGCTAPSKPAIINAFNPAERLSFKELYLRSLSVATFLQQQSNNFRHGNCVATVLPNVIDFPAIILGTGLIGGATSPASAQASSKELETQFKDCKASIVFCADTTLEKVLEATANCPKIKKIVCLKSGLLPEGSPDVILPRNVTDYKTIKHLQPALEWKHVEINCERDIFLLPYSSGTTGSPKGVMISNKGWSIGMTNFSSFFKKEIFPFINKEKPVTANDPMQCFLPFYHTFGLITVCFNLYLGHSTVALPVFKFDQMCKTIQDFKIRMIFAVPPILINLANHPDVDKYDLSSLENISVGAAPLPEDIMYALHKRLPNLKNITQGYGMTETICSHVNTLREKNIYGSVGRLLPGFEMKIVDPETKKELGYNKTGEICMKSSQVMLGYLDKPSSTAAMKDDDGWLYTGDIGYIDENEYTYIVDRMKELIKVNGLQVAPAELENLLLTHPKIKDAAVIGIPDERKGEIPRAYVVADMSKEDGEEVTEDEIKAFVATKSAPYKQLVGGVEFVKEIPKSPSGKILRRLLRERFKKSQEEDIA